MNAEGFDTLVATHHREIYRFLVRATFRASEADDLAQETFLRAYRAHRTLPTDANARAWRFAIASNVANSHFRAASARRGADALTGSRAWTVGSAAPTRAPESPRARRPWGPPRTAGQPPARARCPPAGSGTPWVLGGGPGRPPKSWRTRAWSRVSPASGAARF